MRAGTLNRVIAVDRLTTTLNENRNPVSAWTNIATLRAEVLQHTVDEADADSGDRDSDTITIRTRFFTGLTTADRIRFMGRTYNVKGWTEIGIRAGLEIRAVAA
ncbi:phage head closure protein [Sinorhizobium meliloti]|nr:phage head closure protein [Sinorhizobium meliloti]